MKRTIFILMVLLSLTAFTGIAAACPACKETVANSAGSNNSGAGLPNAFNTSIYLMLGGLFAVLGTFGTYIVRTIRRADRAAMTAHGFPVIASDA